MRYSARSPGRLHAPLGPEATMSSTRSSPLTEETLTALSVVMPEDEIRQHVEKAYARTNADVYKVITHVAIASAAGGRGALFTIEKAIKALCYQAHVVQTRIISVDIWAGAFQLLGGGAAARECMEELMEYLAQSKLPLFTLLDSMSKTRWARGASLGTKDLDTAKPRMEAGHPSIQDYYAACAIRDHSFTLPILPWQLSSWWAPVVRFGSELGRPFWSGLVKATPALTPEATANAINIRNMLGGDRATSLAALSGFIDNRGDAVERLDWSQLMLGDLQARALFTSFGEGTLPRLTSLYLHENALGEAGADALGRSIGAGALPQLQELQLTSTGLGSAGLKALSLGFVAGGLPLLKRLYLNSNEIGDEGVVALASAVKPRPQLPEGALAQCEVLTLAYNNIGERGVQALAESCELGSLPSLERFLVACNPCSAAPVTRAILRARKPRPRKVVAHYKWPDEPHQEGNANVEGVVEVAGES